MNPRKIERQSQRALLDTARVQRSVSFLGLLCRMPVPILKHRLELQGISHVVSLVSFSDVKAFEENNFTRLNHRSRFIHTLYRAFIF